MHNVLFKRHFQLAYVVDDVQKSIAALKGSYGIAKWDVLDMAAMMGAGGPARFIANAWIGDVMIELIEPDENVPSIYAGWQKQLSPAPVNPLRLHHFGFLVDSAEEFAAHCQQLAESGYPEAMAGSFGDVLNFHYADTTPTLGHYYEIIFLKDAGKEFFGRIPRN